MNTVRLIIFEGMCLIFLVYYFSKKVNVDDCWLEKNRGPNNELVADRRRFPSGMKSLSDYVMNFMINRF